LTHKASEKKLLEDESTAPTLPSERWSTSVNNDTGRSTSDGEAMWSELTDM
jgi:hypothetical protein